MSDLVERLRHADEYAPLGHDGWEAADRIEALEAALNLAANRLARCALDHGIGTQEFLEVSEWGEEARAALDAYRGRKA